MDILSSLTKSTIRPSRRVGRGYGSKKGGHTTGRGAKGDKVRGTTRITFDGTKIKKGWIKRTPFLRGKHRLLPASEHTLITLASLEKWFKAGDTVDRQSISRKSGIKETDLSKSIKVLAQGKLTKALTFKGINFSESAKSQILAAGGKIE